MFVGITNTPREYAWGSSSAIAELLDQAPSGSPEAELWLGAHEGSPSRIIDPSLTGGAEDLAQWIAADPATALGAGRSADRARLPFLLKILAAASPLSLQAHPAPAQALEGFARENAAGIPLDSPSRNYRDPYPKPELIVALSETFDALCGFRTAAAIRETIARLVALDAPAGPGGGVLQRWLDRTGGDDSIRSAFEWLSSRGDGVDELIVRVVELARENPEEFPTVVTLAELFPGDPGIVISLMLNHVRLRGGEALYLPAGNIHAYLEGVGVELMTASDNVLRGGLTPKHVDVPELLAVLDFRPVAVPYLRPEHPEPGVEVYRPDVPDFLLARITDDARLPVGGPAIIVCTEGSFTVSGDNGSIELGKGDSVYVTPDESVLRFAGEGSLFVATTG
ncbi:MAG: mannose-6-phosphate isomerase [Rhodoglobus sp.]|nr:mannose-6-phosphate isomerase [Rhodoglobus sp.]